MGIGERPDHVRAEGRSSGETDQMIAFQTGAITKKRLW